MKPRNLLLILAVIFCALAITSIVNVGADPTLRSVRSKSPVRSALADASEDPRSQLGLVSEQVLQGADLFFRETFGGNGRSCGTCHPPSNNLVVDPDFIATLPDNDPIFVAEDPTSIDTGNNPNLVNLEIPFLMRSHGLIFENLDGFDDPLDKFMMRSVPHVLSLSISIMPSGPGNVTDFCPPNQPPAILPDCTNNDPEQGGFTDRTGWSGDGAPIPGGLGDFLTGAVIQHYTRNFFVRDPDQHRCGLEQNEPCFILPTDDELDKVEVFLLNTGRLNELDLPAVRLTDRAADRGRKIFQGLGMAEGLPNGKCFGCHTNAGANSAFGGNRSFNTGIELARLEILGDGNPGCMQEGFIDPSTGESRCIPFDGAFGGQELMTFNFDTDNDGTPDAFGNGVFNAPPLAEAADTPPFFHTNAFETIEDAVAFYSSEIFNNSPASTIVRNAFGVPPDQPAIDLNTDESDAVAAFLRVVNASFNAAIALQRVEAVQIIEAAPGFGPSDITDTLLELANEELEDAVRVLKDADLNKISRKKFTQAMKKLNDVLTSKNAKKRRNLLSNAVKKIADGNHRLGRGLDFLMGEGNLAF